MQNHDNMLGSSFKKVLPFVLILILVLSVIPLNTENSQGQTDGVRWYSYSEGLSKAKEEGKPVFIDFWASWCGPCQQMEDEVYPDQDVIEKSRDFINIKVNVDENGDLAGEYGVDSIPTLVFLNSDGEEVSRNVGALSADGLVSEMDDVLDTVGQNDDGSGGSGVEDTINEGGSTDSSEEESFWQSFIFIEIIISVIASIAIVLALYMKKEDEEEEGE